MTSPAPPDVTPAPLSRVVLWGPVVAYMALIFALSARSVLPSPLGLNDKVVHFAFYGGLATLALRATAGGRLAGLSMRAMLAAWAIASVYGASDEFHQSFVPGRSADPWDLLADAAGAALAVVVFGASGIIARSRGPAARAPRGR